MTVKFEFSFDGYQDFLNFIDKHESTINKMNEGPDKLTDQIKRQVEWNQQLPEHFTFTDTQYAHMVRRDKEGMQKLTEDNRVTVDKIEDDGE